jgi:hypothetical protein
VDHELETRTDSTANHGNDESLLDEVRRHRLGTAALVLCIVGGAAIGAFYLPESIGLVRRVLGGALLGGVSWLLVMVGRLIGGD